MIERTVAGLDEVVSSRQSRRCSPSNADAIQIINAKATTAIERRGYAFVPAADMHALLREEGLIGWSEFASSWNDLLIDAFMGDAGKYRRRRYAEFAVAGNRIARKPHGPHYQSWTYNPLNGGIDRWFEPIAETIASHPALRAMLRASGRLIDTLTPVGARPHEWHVEVHQFRIVAHARKQGYPTPEGIHRDGVDWALMLLVARESVRFGETIIRDLRKRPLESFTLAAPFDATIVDDRRVYHEVTPIATIDKSDFGFRDTLVVTFSRRPQRLTPATRTVQITGAPKGSLDTPLRLAWTSRL